MLSHHPPSTTSPSGDFEPNFHFQDLNPGIDIAESFTSLQPYHCSKLGQKFGETKEEEASGSSPKCTEDLDKFSQSCCCSKIHPTVNVSSRKPLMAEFSSSLGFDQSLSFASSHYLMQQSRASSLLTKMPNHEISQAKRPCTLKQQKPTQATPKRTRVEPRATCPPLKIRKEKLGDRIAALQQLVAPFGKTDTASVLMEAISYINFLQNQVEMLSHSYMKSCRHRNYKTMCRDGLNEENKEGESDLKGKGLCLVPLASIFDLPEETGGGGGGGGRIGGIWGPLAVANFNRRTF
ncbi:transcription factor bHLH110-like isoform X2 [Momordica charantia]|uniref:Transcription factor bHLH110-like isoform X2 n=1 Tax=Momordica charantia TaxID=3673 RepID=A0A6J1CS00_MOMCH|nr:transcription factor bHLH110-like isoform X2 [Momordica charantia]